MKKKDVVSELQSKISDLKIDFQASNAGIVTELGDGVVNISGLDDVTMGEIVIFSSGAKGLVLNLNQDSVGAIVLDGADNLAQGDSAHATGRLLTIPASEQLLGRVIDSLGNPVDGKSPIEADQYMPMEKVAPGVIARKPVSVPLQTGVKAIDSMIPIGRGQRELIIGDRSTGKTAIALTSIMNQKSEDVICIYVSIGQKRSSVAQTINIFEKNDAMKYTIIVAATASEPAAMQYLAPYAGVAIAEYFAAKGRDVLIVYDDLTKHAWSYREVSLLLRRPSGREAYPGDVFYLHSRLLERAVRLSEEYGGGSITALPIIETQAGDVSAYIPTNVISITDGQIFLEADMFNSGQRPAIDLGVSVSRVGGAAQIKAMKQVIGSLKIDMAQFRELAAFAQFSSDLDPKTKAQLERGQRITEILKQGWDEPMTVDLQIAVFWAIKNNYVDQVKIDQVKEWENGFVKYMQEEHQDLLEQIKSEQKLNDDIESGLKKAVESYNDSVPQLMISDKE